MCINYKLLLLLVRSSRVTCNYGFEQNIFSYVHGTTSDGTLHMTARGGQSVHKMRRQIRVTIMCMRLNGSGTVSVHIVR